MEINLSIEAIVAYIFGAFSLIYFLYIIKRRRVEIWEAIKGEDKKLQLTEIAALYWFCMFPVVFFGDLFLNLQVSSEIWYSMDFIFMTIIAGHSVASFKKKDEK